MAVEYLKSNGSVLQYLTELPTKGKNCVRLVCVSDTHLAEDKLKVPDGDVLLHCGDILMQSTLMSKEKVSKGFRKFLSWIGNQPHKHKIFILGNHDAALMDLGHDYIKSKCPPGVVYLQNTDTTVCGLKIWGTPHSVGGSSNYAFQYKSANGLWDSLPSDTDIIMSHGPALCIGGDHLSKTDEFIKKIKRSTDVKLHLCGHLHWAYGMQSITRQDGVLVPSIVCSSLDGSYQLTNKPVVADICLEKTIQKPKKKCLFLIANDEHLPPGKLIADLISPYYDVMSLNYSKRKSETLSAVDAVVCLGISAVKAAMKYPTAVTKVVYSHTGRSDPTQLHDYGIHMIAAARDEQTIVAFLNACAGNHTSEMINLRLKGKASLQHQLVKSVK